MVTFLRGDTVAQYAVGKSPTAEEERSTIINYHVDLYISICEDAFVRTVIVPEGTGRVPNTTLQRDAFFDERAQM